MESRNMIGKILTGVFCLAIIVLIGLTIFQHRQINNLPGTDNSKVREEAPPPESNAQNPTFSSGKRQVNSDEVDDLSYQLTAAEEELGMAREQLSNEISRKAELREKELELRKKYLEAPGTKEMIRNSIKADLDAFYGPLFKRLDLSPESLDEFKDIIADQRMAMIDMGTSINGASSEEEKTDIQQEYDTFRDEYNDKYIEFLGQEKYELLKAYNDSSTERNYLNGFLETVPLESRINEDQVEMLVSSMHKVVEEVSAERGFDDKEIVFPSDVDEEKIAYLIGVMTRINEGFIDASKDVLEPSQVEQFEDFLNQQRDISERALEIQALEYGG